MLWNIIKSLGNFEIAENKVLQDVTISTFDFANVSHWLSGVHWQHTQYKGHVRKHPMRLSGDGFLLFHAAQQTEQIAGSAASILILLQLLIGNLSFTIMLINIA